jgi:hypothetical protein
MCHGQLHRIEYEKQCYYLNNFLIILIEIVFLSSQLLMLPRPTIGKAITLATIYAIVVVTSFISFPLAIN